MTLTATEQEEKLAALKVLSLLAEVPVEVKKFHSDWILLTYDLPNTKAGVKARYAFLNSARYLGAMMHTESVYLLPWTDAANAAAMALAEAGDIVVWHASPGDNQHAVVLTRNYDKGMKKVIGTLSDRADRIVGHAEKSHEQQVRRMADKTWELINSFSKAVVSRGDEKLAKDLLDVISKVKYAEELVG